jgi:putative flippase GtrA
MNQILERLRQPNLKTLRQFIKFGLVGVLNTAIDAGIYFLLTRYVPFFTNRQVFAKGISYTAGVINSFIWNRSWTFRSNVNPWRAFGPFFIVNLVGIGINTGVMYIGLNLLHLNEVISFLAATGFTILWNFTISKLVIFKV